ncbi:uncharacterized protein LOC118179665, partial [Stegodyphus dumicola]|uniref:uncharacterized protein LOC118179665 n=1 Tax=Stegodyphus dumicola TaxID=202533 RepID=UPI0015AB0C13
MATRCACYVTSKLRVSNNILFTFAKDYENGVISIDRSSGKELWKANINESARYIQCGKLDTPQQETCIVMDGEGRLKLINPLDGSVLWSRDIQEEEKPSLPLILPDCNNDNLEEVAVAVSKSKIKIVFGGGSVVSFVTVSGCDAIPVKLTAWNTTENTTDLLFVCQRKENEVLVRVPESKWCLYSTTPKLDTSILTSRNSGVLSSSLLLPTEESLVLWTESEVTLLETNGTQRWQVSSGPHSSQNRFALFGKFDGKEKQVALFSSDFLTGFQVSTFFVLE